MNQFPPEDIRKILEAGARAPSGSNSQPWSFRVRDNQIDIIALPEKDHPILNFRYRGTWVAHGALLENILIAASALGYDAKFDLFPDKSNQNLTARIVLEKSLPKDKLLYDAIFKRATNRKPYKNIPLTSGQKLELLNCAREIGAGEIKLIEDPQKLKILGEALAVNEIIMFENKALHTLLFNEIVWSREEEKRKGGGLYIKTMELKPPQQIALRYLFKHWPVMNFLNKFGLARKIAQENAAVYASAGAMGIIITEDDDLDFLRAGRLMEFVWLKATSMGLGFHIITGVPFLWQRIRAGDIKFFSKEHIELIESAYEKIASLSDVSGHKIASMIFRVGDGGEPSARSEKKKVEIEYS